MKVATRGSALAQYQANRFIDLAHSQIPGLEKLIVETKGDRDHRPFAELGGDGYFTKEIENKLFSDEAQFAVHSAKDLPSLQHSDYPWYAFDKREATHDILIISKSKWQNERPLANSVIGTSSPRRRAQIQFFWRDVEIHELRGNVPTRIQKCLNGDYDGIILAYAGVSRLDLLKEIPKQTHIIVELPWATAPTQGIMAVQSKMQLQNTNERLTKIAHAEKQFLKFLGGGCQLPLGASIESKGNWKTRIFLSEEDRVYDFETESHTLESSCQLAFEKLCNFSGTGKKIWLTQPLEKQRKIGARLAKSNFHPIFFPLIDRKIHFNGFNPSNVDTCNHDSLVLTSTFGAKLAALNFGEVLKQFSDENRLLAIGAATGSFLSHLGLNVLLPKDFHGPALESLLSTKGFKNPLIVGATQSHVSKILQDKKYSFGHWSLYKTSPVLWEGLPDKPSPKDAILFTSPSAIEALPGVTSDLKEFKEMRVFVIGPTTEKAAREAGFSNIMSSQSGNINDLLDLILEDGQ